MSYEGEEDETYSGYIELFAFWISIIAVHVYIFTYLCCFIAETCFVEGIIFVTQFLRIVLVAGSVVPAVVHCQIFWLAPGLSSETFPPVVLGLMFFNIIFAFFARDALVIISCWFPSCEPPVCECPKPKKKKSVCAIDVPSQPTPAPSPPPLKKPYVRKKRK